MTGLHNNDHHHLTSAETIVSRRAGCDRLVLGCLLLAFVPFSPDVAPSLEMLNPGEAPAPLDPEERCEEVILVSRGERQSLDLHPVSKRPVTELIQVEMRAVQTTCGGHRRTSCFKMPLLC